MRRMGAAVEQTSIQTQAASACSLPLWGNTSHVCHAMSVINLADDGGFSLRIRQRVAKPSRDLVRSGAPSCVFPLSMTFPCMPGWIS